MTRTIEPILHTPAIRMSAAQPVVGRVHQEGGSVHLVLSRAPDDPADMPMPVPTPEVIVKQIDAGELGIHPERVTFNAAWLPCLE